MSSAIRRLNVDRHPAGPGEDEVVREEPLQIKVEGRAVAITMRTPGDDLDLVAGFLWTEGVIDGPDDLVALASVGENVVDARLADGVPAARSRAADRASFSSSSCGVCGKETVDRLIRSLLPLQSAWEPGPELLLRLPGALTRAQPAWTRTGGLHAAALFDRSGNILDVREDVGRHNAVDKLLGARLRTERLDLGELGMVVTSRAGFEIVQKAWVGRVPVLAVFGPPTDLAVTTARAAGMRLYGWLRPNRYLSYGASPVV